MGSIKPSLVQAYHILRCIKAAAVDSTVVHLEHSSFFKISVIPFFRNLSQDMIIVQKFLGDNLKVDGQKNLQFLLEDPASFHELQINTTATIKYLFDQSKQIEANYPLMHSFQNIKVAFSYPSGFGKTTFLKLLQSYHNKTDLNYYLNWKLINRLRTEPSDCRAIYFDLSNLSFRKVILRLLKSYSKQMCSQKALEILNNWKKFNVIDKENMIQEIQLELSEWVPNENLVLLFDQFHNVVSMPQKHDPLLVLGFFSKVRTNPKIALLCSSIRPVSQLRFQLDQMHENQKILQELSKLMREMSDTGSRFHPIFTYEWNKIELSYSYAIKDIMKSFKFDLFTLQQVIEDCFNGYQWIEGQKSMHPYFLTVLKNYKQDEMQSMTLDKFQPFSGQLLVCLKIGFGLVQLNIKQSSKQALQKYRFKIMNGYIFDNQTEQRDWFEILMLSGAFKGPYDLKLKKVQPDPPNREVRLALKLKSLLFYQINSTCPRYKEKPPSMMARFLSLQQEAERREDHPKPLFKTIQDILDIWWLFKVYDYSHIHEPFNRFSTNQVYMLGSHYDHTILLLVLDQHQCVVFMSQMDQTTFKMNSKLLNAKLLKYERKDFGLFQEMNYKNLKDYITLECYSSGDFHRLLIDHRNEGIEKLDLDILDLHGDKVLERVDKSELIYAKFYFKKSLPGYARESNFN